VALRSILSEVETASKSATRGYALGKTRELKFM